MKYTFYLNGKKVFTTSSPTKKLLDIIRDDFELTGTKSGCREGECGSCLVLLDGDLVNSCLIPAFRVENKRVKTIEGISRERGFAELNQRLSRGELLECGLCRNGILMAAMYLFSRRSVPRVQDIQEGLSGNLCHCTGHRGLVEAIGEVFTPGKL